MASSYKRNRRSRLTNFLKPKKIGALVVLVVLIVFIILEVSGVTHVFKKSAPSTSSVIPSSSNTTSSSPGSTPSTSLPTSKSANQTSSKDTTASNSSSTPSTSTNGPIKPYGTFVNNHTPPQNGTAEVSYCYTTPGATCTMVFTSSGQTSKTLAAQTTDGNGATSWKWDAASLNPGHWTITVTASLNGKTSTATDSMDVGS